jgi:hypothetical protein
VISSSDEFLARLEATGRVTDGDLLGWRQMLAEEPDVFLIAARAWLRAGAGPDRTFWQALAADLDPVSDFCAKLMPVISIAIALAPVL